MNKSWLLVVLYDLAGAVLAGRFYLADRSLWFAAVGGGVLLGMAICSAIIGWESAGHEARGGGS